MHIFEKYSFIHSMKFIHPWLISPHHSDQMSQRSQVSADVRLRSRNTDRAEIRKCDGQTYGPTSGIGRCWTLACLNFFCKFMIFLGKSATLSKAVCNFSENLSVFPNPIVPFRNAEARREMFRIAWKGESFWGRMPTMGKNNANQCSAWLWPKILPWSDLCLICLECVSHRTQGV